jgi:hypothetical protein
MRERIVPELHWHGLTRFLELIERPWRLIYRIDGSTVYVVSVWDGRRQLEDLLLARFLRHEFITRLCGGSLNSDCRVWIKADRRIFFGACGDGVIQFSVGVGGVPQHGIGLLNSNNSWPHLHQP